MSDSVTPWPIAHQAPLSMGFLRQEYWSGLPCPPPEDLPSPGIKPMSPALAGRLFTTEPPGKPLKGWGQQSFLSTPSGIYDRIHGLVYPMNWGAESWSQTLVPHVARAISWTATAVHPPQTGPVDDEGAVGTQYGRLITKKLLDWLTHQFSFNLAFGSRL